MGGQVVEAFRQVLGLFLRGFDFDVDRRRGFERQLEQLIPPHLPVLVDRRAKLLECAGEDLWSDELDRFMRASLWPFLGADLDYAERNRTFATLLIDVTIEREQHRTPRASSAAAPLVSRFDASWAN